jgi:transposase-like protein
MGDRATVRNAKTNRLVPRDDLRAPGPKRRVFTVDYKLAILAEYGRCSEPGEKGALLRREGLYSSLVTDWRRQHREGALVATPGRDEGGRGGPSRSEVARLRAENEQLKRQLAKAQAIIERCREKCTRSWSRSPRAPSRRPSSRRSRRRSRPVGSHRRAAACLRRAGPLEGVALPPP